MVHRYLPSQFFCNPSASIIIFLSDRYDAIISIRHRSIFLFRRLFNISCQEALLKSFLTSIVSTESTMITCSSSFFRYVHYFKADLQSAFLYESHIAFLRISLCRPCITDRFLTDSLKLYKI